MLPLLKMPSYSINNYYKIKLEIELSSERFQNRETLNLYLDNLIFDGTRKCSAAIKHTDDLEKIIADFTNQTRIYSSDVELIIERHDLNELVENKYLNHTKYANNSTDEYELVNATTAIFYENNTTSWINSTESSVTNSFTEILNAYFTINSTFNEVTNSTDYNYISKFDMNTNNHENEKTTIYNKLEIETSTDFNNQTVNETLIEYETLTSKSITNNSDIYNSTELSTQNIKVQSTHMHLNISTSVLEYILSTKVTKYLDDATKYQSEQNSNFSDEFASTHVVINQQTSLYATLADLIKTNLTTSKNNYTFDSVINAPIPLTIYDIISFSNANFFILFILFSMSFVILVILLFKVAVIQFRYETFGSETSQNKDIEYLSNSNETIVTGIKYFSEESLIVDYNRNELFRAFRQFRLDSDGNAIFKNSIGVFNLTDDEGTENTYL